jgi:hypothetical protein
MDFDDLFLRYTRTEIAGRYITNNSIKPLLDDLSNTFGVGTAGYSVQDKPIYSVTVGVGKIKIFMWSQMHGNEATTTKAIVDFLYFLDSDDDFARLLKESFTFFIIPIVNPDGAALYTRENANKVDLNRDSVNLSQPESKMLRKAFEEFEPHYCYNMHDQRTIFGAGDTGMPATVSFLAPSYNEERDINDVRQKAINVIAAMNNTLQQYIRGQVGRFDDGFNINCIGDMFQSLNVPTILFEAGHYKDDYNREISRKYIFIALLSGFKAIHENDIVVNKNHEYFDIPQNKINFYDIKYKNVKINYENKQIITNFASHYKEVLFENSIIFCAFIKEIGDLTGFRGHVEYDCKEGVFTDMNGNHLPKPDEKADFFIDTYRKFINGIEK